MRKANVLFLCTANDARSQMAEAFLRREAADRFDVFSAGLRPTAIHPLTIRVMDEVGIDLAGHSSKGVAQFLGRMGFRYAIFVCRPGQDGGPRIFPSASNRLYWEIADPAAVAGTDTEKLDAFRSVRDELALRIREWAEEHGGEPVGAGASSGDLSYLIH